MKKILTIVLIVALLAVGVGMISAKVTHATDGEPAINGTALTVYGNASVALIPDTAAINLGVITRAKTVDAAQTENTNTMTAVLNALKRMGIDDEDIKTVAFNIYPQYDYSNETRKLVDYEVRNEISVTLRDIDSVGKVLTNATNAGANSAGSISFSSSKEQQAYTQALALAFNAAKAKGTALADAVSMKVNGLVSVQEGVSYSAPVVRSATYFAADEAVAVPIEAGQLTVNASVTVVYSMK